MILKASIVGMLVVLVIVVYLSSMTYEQGFVGEIPTGAATGATTGAATGATTGAATGAATGATTGAATGATTGATTGAATVGNSSSTNRNLGSPLTSATSTVIPPSASRPNRIDITPDTDMRKATQQAMQLKQKSDFLRDLQTIIRNELRASRSTDTSTMEKDSSCGDTDAISQGNEYASNMIKKDSIPCWGCSLDY